MFVFLFVCLFVSQITGKYTCYLIFSPGRIVTELNVPGVKLEILKRPYDTAVRLLIQDLCLVDRIQTFGPEYELVICSSGKTIFPVSPISNKAPEKPVPSAMDPEYRTQENVNKPGEPAATSISEPPPDLSRLESISTDVFNLSSEEEDSGALLALTYTSISPYSPHHPAIRDLEQDEDVGATDGESSIQKINVQCTAIDALGRLNHSGPKHIL